MFDKITIQIDNISQNECEHLARVHFLRVVSNGATGEITGYMSSSKYSQTSGTYVVITIKNGIRSVKLTTSLHKLWNKRTIGGKLRNDNLFTISEAKLAFSMFLSENGLLPGRVKIVYFEIGLNLPVSGEPTTFIHLARAGIFRGSKGEFRRKSIYIDANYIINKQKTTEKNKHIRKVYKIYDKSHEVREKERGTKNKPKLPPDPLSPKIIRIETIYKRRSEPAIAFFSDSNIHRLVTYFYLDWKDLFFIRKIKAYKGARKSEIDKAEKIINLGSEYYLELIKKEFEAKKLTEKQYRTIREFIRDFQDNRDKYIEIKSNEEKEYKLLFNRELKKAKQ